MGVRVGEKVPHFSGIDQHGNHFDSTTMIGQKPLVVYFYPKDDTRVCTAQACAFRDQYEDFKMYGAEVIGISSDSLASHAQFAQKYQLPFILLSDPGGEIRRRFGVPNDLFGLIPGRATYVVDSNGIIRLVFDSTAGKIHIEKALEILKTM